MAMTLAEKIIARAAGTESVAPGEIVTCAVDLAMVHDSSGPRRIKPKLDEIGATLWDPSKIVVVTDHYITEDTPQGRDIQEITRAWAADTGVHLLDREGICHIVLPERGYLRPGMFAVGADSHSTTGGAFGAFMTGIGSTEMAGVFATGEIWVRVPPTILVRASGRLGPGVAAKDIMLMLCAAMGFSGANYKVVEFAGPAVAAMPMHERMVLTNMCAELSAKTGIIAADAVTREFLLGAGVTDMDLDAWRSDADAAFERVIEIDASALAPHVAAPHTPENSAPVDTHEGTPIDQGFIGACTGAKLEDLHMAASVVRGRTLAEGFPLYVAPASVRMARQAEADGTMATLIEAGATLLPSACGGCIGLGPARLAAGRTGISSSSRNFRGRMGDAQSAMYLGSPYTVAAAAVTGRITDPRTLLAEDGA